MVGLPVQFDQSPCDPSGGGSASDEYDAFLQALAKRAIVADGRKSFLNDPIGNLLPTNLATELRRPFSSVELPLIAMSANGGPMTCGPMTALCFNIEKSPIMWCQFGVTYDVENGKNVNLILDCHTQ